MGGSVRVNQIAFGVREMKPWSPHKYQIQGIRFLLEHACAALFLDPGLGKTSITLGGIKILHSKGIIRKTLIVAPLRVCYNVWPNEVQKWEDFSHLKVVVLHGKDKAASLKSDADIFVINPEGLDWLLDVKKEKYETRTGKVKTRFVVDEKRFAKLGFDLLVIDELSKFKNHESGRFKAMKPLLGLFQRRWGLTGSPVANGLGDLFGQCYILDEGRSLGRYVTAFREAYFTPDRAGFVWTLKPGAEEQIYERIAPLALRMGTELLDMPELINNVIKVDLPPAVMATYIKFERDLVTAFGDGLVTAGNAAALSSKLRQIVCGGIYLDREEREDGLLDTSTKRKWENIHTAKVDALADLKDELQGQPMLVAYDFQHDLDRLRKAFPRATYACDFPANRFSEVERAWNEGGIDMLFGHPASIGHGLNLQEGPGHHIVWHSQTWDYDQYDQFVRRIFRQGVKSRRVFVHHLVATGTIDELVYYAILGKKSVQDAFFKWLSERRKR